MVHMLQGYCIIASGVRISCYHQTGKRSVAHTVIYIACMYYKCWVYYINLHVVKKLEKSISYRAISLMYRSQLK